MYYINLREKKVVPHFSARLVDGPDHAKELAAWVAKNGIKEVFIISGDVEEPRHYDQSLPFMDDFLKANPSSLQTVGKNALLPTSFFHLTLSFEFFFHKYFLLKALASIRYDMFLAKFQYTSEPNTLHKSLLRYFI